MQTSIETFNKTLQKTNEWLTELANGGPFYNKEQAYTALRAVLHALRDRLLPDQAIQFPAEFPLLLKGVYFDNWDFSATPTKERTKEAFLQHIRLELRNAAMDIDPGEALTAVICFLSAKISEGSLEKMLHQLPSEIHAFIHEGCLTG